MADPRQRARARLHGARAALARRTLGLGLLGLALVATGGVVAARRLSWPLRRLAAHALRIGRRRRDAHGPADPRDEIGTLAHSLHRAAQTDRDRALVSDLLGRYVNPDLAQRWLKERRTPRLAGERREVAVLMSDLRGFSALSEQLGPEAVFSVLNRYLGRMTEVIHAHGGAINELLGDGILVLFGAPTAQADDAARAVRCAWAMQEALAALNAEGLALGHPELRMGIGLNAGMVVAGHIGGRNRAAYTVVGPVVNRTARMVDLARAGEVLLSDVMLTRVRDDVEVGSARRAAVKGVSDPLIVYRLLGLREHARPATGAPGDADAERPDPERRSRGGGPRPLPAVRSCRPPPAPRGSARGSCKLGIAHPGATRSFRGPTSTMAARTCSRIAAADISVNFTWSRPPTRARGRSRRICGERRTGLPVRPRDRVDRVVHEPVQVERAPVGVQDVQLAEGTHRLQEGHVEGAHEPLVLLRRQGLRCRRHGVEDARRAAVEARHRVADEVVVDDGQRGLELRRVLLHERAHRVLQDVPLQRVPRVEDRVHDERLAAQLLADQADRPRAALRAGPAGRRRP